MKIEDVAWILEQQLRICVENSEDAESRGEKISVCNWNSQYTAFKIAKDLIDKVIEDERAISEYTKNDICKLYVEGDV